MGIIRTAPQSANVLPPRPHRNVAGQWQKQYNGLVKELTGRDVPTILDPVFFLSKNEWLERIPNKREINEPYIFAYFLGAKQEYRNEVKKLAHDKGMKVVALRHMDQYVEEDENFGDFAPYDVSPEWMYL